MSLEPGTRLGPYEIVAPLGAGGMGEVYRAKDTRLDRTVALKVLPSELSANPALRERLEREARAVSSLNHPHICTLHDIGHQDGVDYLVLEHIEGETLADRLKKGPLPLDRALKHAVEIADALDKAHRQGVVHRDLKPGNIMLTKSGAKLLDFGLAKLQQSTGGAPALSQMPTKAKPLTDEGTVLGTFQYMSPEQLEGKDADARTDIFAFGAVLYEMLTGRRAFEGKSQASLIAAILEHDPPALTELQPLTPPMLDRVVRRCLEKDPDERWQSAGDLAAELRWIDEAVAPDGGGHRVAMTRTTLVAGLALAAAFFVLGWLARPASKKTEAPTRKLDLAIQDLQANVGSAPVISPDGARVVYYASGGLWVRELSTLGHVKLPDTQGARYPFWSPDSQHVGFIRGNRLWKIPADGSEVIELGAAPRATGSAGAAWGTDDRIVVAGSSLLGLVEFPARGGDGREILALAPEREVDFHQVTVLPGGRGVVFTVHRSEGTDTIASFADGTRRVLLQIPGVWLGFPAYSPTGHLVYERATGNPSVWAVGLALDRLEVVGEPFLVVPGGAAPSVAADGTLVYVDVSGGPRQVQLVRRDRNGEALGPIGQPQDGFSSPRLSPDGRRVAVQGWEGGVSEIWIHEVDRPIKSRLTFGGEGGSWPTWSPAGDRLAYNAQGHGSQDIFVKAVDGRSEPEVMIAAPSSDNIADWSPDGRYVLFSRPDPKSGERDLWYADLEADRGRAEPVPFVERPEHQELPKFSPDGRYVAYLSNESGGSEVYVERFPQGGGKVQVSSEGATQLHWGRNGEIFYVPFVDQARPVDLGKLVAVPVTTAPTLTVGAPRVLFDSPGLVGGDTPKYDVSADGQSFFIAEPVGEPSPPVIRVVQNWFEEFRDQQAGSD